MTSDATAPVGEDEKPPLGVIATLVWGVLLFVAAQVIGTVVIFAFFAEHAPSSLAEVRYEGPLVALVTLVTNPVIVVLAGLVARLAGHEPLRYLGLVGFRLGDLLRGVVVVAIMVAVIDTYSWLAGHEIVSSFQTEAFSTARGGGWVWALVLAVVVVGPLGEEVLFRGFLFRGWVRDGWWGILAIVIITAIWTALHVQYDWFGIMQVFLIGLVLGWLRWRSGSTMLTLVLHVLVNAESTVETMVKIAWAA